MRTESEIFQFGVFRFNSEMLELIRNGLRIPLQLQPAQLLGLLLSSLGQAHAVAGDTEAARRVRAA